MCVSSLAAQLGRHRRARRRYGVLEWTRQDRDPVCSVRILTVVVATQLVMFDLLAEVSIPSHRESQDTTTYAVAETRKH